MHKSVFLLFSLFLIAADQLSKWAVSEHVMRARVENGGPAFDLITWFTHTPSHLPYAQVEIAPFFNLVMVWNRGVSFGLFNQDINYGPIALTIISLLITLIFLVLLLRNAPSAASWGYALIIGGALGNVVDRLRFGAVIDFLDFHAAGYHWPAFNIADSCIFVGVALLIIKGLFFEKPQELKV